MNEKILTILTQIKETRALKKDQSKAYKVANEAYQDLWQTEGAKLREALQKAQERLLESPTSSVIGTYNKAKTELEQHNAKLAQMQAARDAIQKEGAALDSKLFKLQNDLLAIIDKEEIAA
jgi:hypothetical protein